MLLENGFSPGVWHQPSTSLDHTIFRLAVWPSAIMPVIESSSNVVAGLTVLAISDASGSSPIRVQHKLETNGRERILQLGLKSVARENGQPFSIQSLNGKSS